MTEPPLESALASLPIFPLPDVVLFPGALMPLHVFEPRYRQLTRDVLEGARLMAMARLKPGYDAVAEERPPVYPVAGVGYVIASEHLEDGRYHLVLRGVGRIRIAEELAPARLYRAVRAQLLVDTHTKRPPAELASGHGQLVALCDRLAKHLDDGGDSLRALVRSIASPAACVDVIAAALVVDPDERQELLETLDPSARMDFLLGHVAALIGQYDAGPRTLN